MQNDKINPNCSCMQNKKIDRVIMLLLRYKIERQTRGSWLKSEDSVQIRKRDKKM
jgi:hypothetical protein